MNRGPDTPRGAPERIAAGIPPRRAGLTLIEVSISTLLVGLLMVTSLRTVGSVLRYRGNAADEHRAWLLANDLLEEILAQPYGPPGALGGGSSSASNRLGFTTVKDYQGWKRSPPRHRSGATLSGFDGWEREVALEWVDPDNPMQPMKTDQGAILITVTVRKQQAVLATLHGVRTNHE